MNFSSLGLDPKILQAIEVCGYQHVTPVQEQALVPARRGRDLLVNAQTGTGKTAAFALPLLQKLIDQPKTAKNGQVRSLVLTPTRELAEQLAHTIGEYAQFLALDIVAVFGGVKMGGQAQQLKAGTDILIATPGRLIEHLQSGYVDLSTAEYVVLDEADRMLDMGFINDAIALINETAKNRQTLLFSATTTPAMNELGHKILRNHLDIRVDKANQTADTVSHVVYPVDEARKIDLFMTLLDQYNWYQILVFTSTKKQADHLLDRLKKQQIPAAICHGDKSQGTRRRSLKDFKAGKVQVLIATEVAARGLDIEGLDFVLNYNLPYLPEDYVHRIGRTGRAGQSGRAISFVCPEEVRFLRKIERLISGSIERIYQRGFELAEREEIAPTLVRQKTSPKKPNNKQTKKQSAKKPNRKKITTRAGGKNSKSGRKKLKKS
ncbi:MAG: DEAD/DEAH box helicase [Marinicella sp.]|nr:DEAD/DEAH box helicase [Xanthomonadales bacterium]